MNSTAANAISSSQMEPVTDRPTDRQINRQTQIERDRDREEIEGGRGRERERGRSRWVEKLNGKQTGK